MYGRSVNTNTGMYFQQIGDFCFSGHTAGGDWEELLFFIIYYDGEQMRGYVPTPGNVFDLPEKAAFGTAEADEKDMVDYLKTEFPQFSEEDLTTSVTKRKFYYDFKWIKNDIIHHFNIQNVQTS